MLQLITKLQADTSGATAIEYGLIAALVSVAAIGALTLLGGSLDTLFSNIATQLDGAVAAMPAT